MDNLVYAAFGLYLLLIIVGGLAAIMAKSLVRALVGLIMTLFGVAGMYFLMAAPFIALMQILIYVGAVSVLIFFAIMLTRTAHGEAGMENSSPKPGRPQPAGCGHGPDACLHPGGDRHQKMPFCPAA